MNKKFMVIALMAALSTVGYAAEMNQGNFDYVYDKVVDIARETSKNIVELNKQGGEIEDLKSQNETQNNRLSELEKNKVNKKEFDEKIKESLTIAGQAQNNAAHALIQNNKQDKDIAALEQNKVSKDELENKLNGKADVDFVTSQVDQAYNDLAGKVDEKLEGKVDKDEFNRLDNEVGQITSDVEAMKGDLNNKVNKDEFEQATDNLQQQIDKNNHISQENDKLLNNKIDKNTSDLNDKIDANKAEQADKDAAQDAEIAKGDRIDKVQNQQIGNLQSQNLEQDKNIQANKDAIAANKAEQDKVNAVQKENNEQQQAAIDKNTSDIATNRNDINSLQQDFAKYDGRLSGLEKKVDNLDNKMNKGLSLMAAMNAVDFQNVQTGEVALGAGIGHYGNAQSVALGVAYSPVEDLTVNAKYSVTAGSPDSFAVGAGATYKFKVGR